jgi:translin
MTSNLNTISEQIRVSLTSKNAARDEAVNRSRELIRHCAESIRAIHRREWEKAAEKMSVARTSADELVAGIKDYPDLYHTGYTQDALKEVVEVFCTFAIVRNQPLPTPVELGVEPAAYLNGLAEAATETRRFILDILRRDEPDTAEAERLLEAMDDIYDQLVTFDFPDAITGGLRRQTDIVRGVLERTRGDLTTTLQQQRLQTALKKASEQLG